MKHDVSVSKLTLHNFRNYTDRRFEFAATPVAIIGVNGSGKTNILEALSLLSPGRGLRSAKLTEMQKQGTESAWAVAASLFTGGQQHDLSTGLDPAPEKEKRIVRIDGETRRSANGFSDYLALLWLTPQMDKLWLEDKSQRRKFLDRLTATFDPAHQGRITRYDNALRERMKLLQMPHYDAAWVLSLEKIIAETGVAIAAHRIDLIERLNAQNHDTSFPHVRVAVDGLVEKFLVGKSALDAEELFLSQLQSDRARDAALQQTSSGPHRSDFLAYFINHSQGAEFPAALCSTGEQKALLISLTLSHAQLIRQERGTAPVLLLDEVLLHLDGNRQTELLNCLFAMQSQFFVTQTELSSVIADRLSIINL